MEQKNTSENKPNFPQMEREILSFWEKEKIFQQTLAQTKGGQPFIFFEGPPTANGKPGIHHMLARAYKDVICRYKTMRGFFVERKAGWDTHGLPVELQVEKELKLSGKPDIEKYGITKFNQKCRESVWKYKQEWEEMTRRIGFWLDLEHPYITYENDYIESLWWIIKQIWDQKLLYRGHKVVPHCPRCGTALSSHEVAQGYEDVTDDSVYVKFKVLEKVGPLAGITGDVYILSWTTTPWTLPGNVALAVGADIDYVVAQQKNGSYVLAKAAMGRLEGKYKVTKEFKGKEIITASYEPLFSIPALISQASYRLYPADFVTVEEGTGVVHTAVMYGEDDYRLGEQVGLPKHHTVDESGRFTADVALWAGKFVKDKQVEQGIIEDLRQRELLYKTEPYTHAYPFCWRCDTPLLYYAKDSWFIKMSGLRTQLQQQNKTINWVPGYIKDGRFGEWLNEVKDWAFSRERYWGTPLPIWICEKCKAQECLGSIQELTERGAQGKGKKSKIDLHRPFVDEVKLKCSCGGTMHRVKEVVDVWFDSGAMPLAQWHYPFENKERIDEGISYPADYIAEAIDQTRGWFYTLLAVATALGKKAPYKNVVCLNLILDQRGQKMSKSRGNVVDPFAMMDRYGADAVRWHLFTMNQPGDTKLFAEKNLEEVVKKHWLIIWNVLTFWRLYAGDSRAPSLGELKLTHALDRWIVARLHEVQSQVTKQLDHYQVTEAGRAIGEFVNELSTWYLRRSRARFKQAGTERDAAVAVLGAVLTEVAKLLAPFAPFFADTLYRSVCTSQASVHLEQWPTVAAATQDHDLMQQMLKVRQAVELGHALRKEHSLKVRQPLAQFIVQTASIEPAMAAIIKDEMNVQAVVVTKRLPSGNEFVVKSGTGIAVALDTTITDELREQGIIRDIVRHINAMRKDARLTINDMVTLYYDIADEELQGIFLHHRASVCHDVIAGECLKGVPENVDLKKVLEISGKRATIAIKKK